jgi:hypothetical protein
MTDTSYLTHDAENRLVDVSTTSNVLPPFRNMVFCQSPDLEIDSGLIALFDDSAPSGWTRFTALDDRFPRAASNYGGTGGSTTHTHNTASSGYTTGTENGTAYASGGTAAAGDHYHTTQAGTTDSANHLPPYLDMVFASIDSDGYGERAASSCSPPCRPWAGTGTRNWTTPSLEAQVQQEAAAALPPTATP